MEDPSFEEILNLITDEEFEKILNEVEPWTNIGPTVDEYFAYVNNIK